MDKARTEFVRGKKSVLCVCATGGGKSYIFMAMCDNAAQKGRVLVLAHRTELLDQHEENFRKNGIPLDNIVIASVQSVYRNLDDYGDIYMVCADEAHLFKARTFEHVIKHFQAKGSFTVGFTATPVRLDGSPMNTIFDSMVLGPGTKELIEQKRLSPYTYLCPATADIARLKKRAGDYAVEDMEAVMDRKIYGDAIREYTERCNGKQGIAFCCSIAHSKKLAQQFRDAGISAEHIDGDLGKRQRKAVMDRFRAGEIQVLCNVNLISEGLSVDGIHVVMLLRPTLSLALYLQQVGRGLRYEPGKVCTILDFVSNVQIHGLPDEKRSWSLDAPPRAHREFNPDGTLTLRQCPTCYKVFKTAPRCPFCGEDYPTHPRELEQIEQIRLKEIQAEELRRENERKAQAATDIKNARSREDFIAIAKKNGYSMAWVNIRCRLRGYK